MEAANCSVCSCDIPAKLFRLLDFVLNRHILEANSKKGEQSVTVTESSNFALGDSRVVGQLKFSRR